MPVQARRAHGLATITSADLTAADMSLKSSSIKWRTSVLCFVQDGVYPHDIGTIVEQEDVAICVGHHSKTLDAPLERACGLGKVRKIFQ